MYCTAIECQLNAILRDSMEKKINSRANTFYCIEKNV